MSGEVPGPGEEEVGMENKYPDGHRERAEKHGIPPERLGYKTPERPEEQGGQNETEGSQNQRAA